MRNIALNYVFGQSTELNMLPLEFTVKTDNAGTSDSYSFTIPTRSGYQYRYVVDWGDGSMGRYTEDASHTYDTAGEKTIKIYGIFSQFYFNNGGDRLKILSVDAWGDVQYSPDNNMANSFYGASNLYYISDGGSWFDSLTIGVNMFQQNQLTSLPDDMTLDNLTNGNSMFRENQLTSLPDDMTLSSLTNGNSMFYNNQLTSLPDGMTLDNLTIGTGMFYNNNLTSLPDDMTLDNLTTGNAMFRENQLTSLPDSMTLDNLTIGNNMFQDNNLTSLPDDMTLSSLTNGNSMFYNNQLTSLPDGMTLDNLTVSTTMFYNNQLTSLPDGMTLDNLIIGTSMFQGVTINTARYSQLLIDMEANNPNNNVPFHGGNSKYNSSAVTARANLVARGWTITDGGLE